jgi:hypothetical protein
VVEGWRGADAKTRVLPGLLANEAYGRQAADGYGLDAPVMPPCHHRLVRLIAVVRLS